MYLLRSKVCVGVLLLVLYVSACAAAYSAQCGDGVLEGSEQCDPPNSACCSDSCQILQDKSLCVKANCTTNGYNAPNGDTCICGSGFTDAGCGTFNVGSCTPNVMTPDVANHYPKLMDQYITFQNNVLKIAVTGDLVGDRIYKSLNFAGANNSRCALGNAYSFWSKDFSTSANGVCKDNFWLTLPWEFNQICGFRPYPEKSNEDFEQLRATIQIRYSDLVGITKGGLGLLNGLEGLIRRETMVSYHVYINFPKTVTVFLQNLNITAELDYFKVTLTDTSYDAANQDLGVTLTTILPWPNQLQVNNIEHDPSLSIGNITVDNSMCNHTTVACKQNIIFQVYLLNNTNKCTYDGEYILFVNVSACRSDEAEFIHCSWALQTIKFNVVSSSVCGEVTVTPTLTGTLKPYHDTDTDDTNNIGLNFDNLFPSYAFTPGHLALFHAALLTEDNTVRMEFTDIYYANNLGDGVVYVYQNRNITDVGHHIDLTIYNTQQFFQAELLTDTFRVDPYGTVTYTWVAVIDVYWYGNTDYKRSVELVYEVDGNDASAASRMKTRAKFEMYDPKMLELSEEETAIFTPAAKGLQVSQNMLIAGVAVVGVAVLASVMFAVTMARRRQSNSNALWTRL